MWMNTSRRRLFLDMHFPDWPNRQTATNFDPERIAAAIAVANIDSVILYAKCQYGNFYYDTKIGHKHSGLGDLDFFRETARELRRRNIRVIAYYSVCWDELQSAQHPEWRVQQADGTVGTEEFRWSTLCINSSYREMVKSHLAEIANDLHPDGFWIDMTIIGKDCCFCSNCQDKYLSQYGRPLKMPPLTPDEHNRFVTFRYDYIETFYCEIYQLLHEIDPEVKISNNYWGYPYSSYTMGSRAIGALRQADYITGEAYTDWTGLSAPGFFSKWLRSAADGRPYEVLIGRFIGTWDYTMKPLVQLALECYTAAANGATVSVDDEPFADGSLDFEFYDALGDIFEEIKKREAFLGGDPLQNAAILHSQWSKDLYFTNEEEFSGSIAGAYRLLKELRCPVEFLFDESLNAMKLAKYKFVLLPRVAVVTDNMVELLLSYVRAGGTLITAGETALYKLRDASSVRSGLWERQLGIKFHGTSAYTVSYFGAGQNRLCEGLPARPITIRGSYAQYDCGDAERLAFIIDPICETTKETFFHNNLPAPYEHTQFPALFKKKLGNGNIFVFAQNIFSQFGRYHQLEIKGLFQNILKECHCEPQIQVYCPSNVETSAWIKGDELVLHLINFNPGITLCTGKMDSFEARYPRTFEFVEEVYPIRDVKINIEGFSCLSAYEVGSGENIVFNKTEKGCKLVLETLTQWATILVRLA